MVSAPRKLAFVLAASDHGTMIVNRLDRRMLDAQRGFGVGLQILETGSFDRDEVKVALQLLDLRRAHFGEGVVAVDCGANIGVHSIEWAKRMTGWGSVIAIEAQERIFYALAGNIALNNCFNARAIHAAVGAADGTMRVPTPDYLSPASFGSLELRRSETNEFIGQVIDYSEDKLTEIRALALDSLGLARIDLIKLDIEGMELEALDGARQSIARFMPIVIVEQIKADKGQLVAFLAAAGYRILALGINLLAIHPSDPSSAHVERK
jgi:FkbM family methyltransferase